MKWVKLTVSLLIAAYLFYGFDFKKVDLSVVSLKSVVLSSFFLFLGQVVLSIRFKYIIGSDFMPAFETIIVSNALNMILPARMGEAVKALYLKKYYGFEYKVSVAAVFVERFFDLIMLFFIVIYWMFVYLENPYIKKLALVLFVLITSLLLFFNSGFVLKMLKKLPGNFFEEFYLSVKLMLKKTHVLLFWSLVLWGIYLLSYIVFFDFLNFKQILEIFILSTIGLMIPLLPAGLGTFEGVVVFYLTKYGISKEEALILAGTYHFILIAVDMVMFYLFLLFKDLSFKDIKGIK